MAKKKKTGVPVSERALFARINRALAREDVHYPSELKRCRRNTRAFLEFGRYYILDTQYGGIHPSNIYLEDYGREMGVLADHEYLAEDE